MRWVDYRKKLGIGFDDKQKCEMLKNNLIEFLPSISKEYVVMDSQRYAIEVGELTDHYSGNPINFVIKSLSRTQTIAEILSKYIALYNSYDPSIVSYRTAQRNNVKEAIIGFFKYRLSELRIQYETIEDEDGLFVFPRGAAELDEALVSAPLEWLSQYPKSRETYVVALKQYSEGIYTRDVADNLRKALETFFQEFLGNNKNLDTNKTEICRYLGGQDVDPGISGLFHSLINAYKKINDENVKHNDGIDSKLLEFFLYQTGLLIRMVITVKQGEVAD